MRRSRVIFHAVVLASLGSLFAACAPEQAEALRQEKAFTLGLPGVSFRPNGKVSVGLTANVTSNPKTTTAPSKPGLSVVSLGGGNSNAGSSGPSGTADPNGPYRDVSMSTMAINPFVQFFPWS